MDSSIDIKVLRNDSKLRAHGEAIAEGVAKYFGLELKKSLKNYLMMGDKGAAVLLLQENLNKIGYSLNVDSIFGPSTEKALKNFQTAQGLTADGLYGPLTKTILESLTKSTDKILYKVQVGAFSQKINAEQLVIELKRKGYEEVHIVKSD